MTHRFPAALLCFWFTLGLATAASAAPLVFNLNCTLNSTPCQPTAVSYGTVTLNAVTGGVSVTVDLAGTGQKFRDMMLNYDGDPTPLTDIDAGNAVSYASNQFSISPYAGRFDIGAHDKKGWDGSDGYTTSLLGPLDLNKFLIRDSSGSNGVYVALHIQNIGSATGGDCDASGTKPACVPGMIGPGSLKIGGTLEPETITNPEPSSMILFGTGLAGLAARRRLRRK